MINLKDFWKRTGDAMLEKILASRESGGVGELTAVSSEMASAIRLWNDMYETKRGLHLPAAIASEMARMITIELNSSISGSSRAEFLNGIYSGVIDNIRVPVEYGCACGGMVMKPYFANGTIVVDFVRAENFIPTAVDDAGKIIGAIFVQRIFEGGTYYTKLEEHSLKENTYTIKNRAYVSRSAGVLGRVCDMGTISAWKDIAEEMTIGNVKAPLFGYFKPATANSIEQGSVLGASVFANAVNLIEDADKQYERLLWEFESGERALIANSMAFRTDKNGNIKLPDKKLYRTLDVDDVDFFREWTPNIRENSYINGLDRIFRQIEFNCGLAYGTLSDANNSDKTAEEIRTSKQRSYATVTDNQKALRNALCDLVYAMDVWCTLYSLAPMGKYDISFDFDDSIVADRKTEFEEKCVLVEKGIMSAWEFRMWYFGEDEAVAKEHIENK